MSHPYFALLDHNLGSDQGGFLFENPIEFIRCDDLFDAESCLAKMTQAQNQGLHLAGYVAYEFAQYFGLKTYPAPTDDWPYLYMGVFAKRQELSANAVEAFLNQNVDDAPSLIAPLMPTITPQNYDAAIHKIKGELTAGNSYQVNFTFENHVKFSGDLFSLYQNLRQSQPVKFGTMLRFPGVELLSRSPELFFEKRGEVLRTRPMKGTVGRATNPAEDAARMAALPMDEKQQAENLMIVDLLRNDMSKLAKPGSVHVEALFAVESYKSVHQMTSSIACEVDNDLSFDAILDALFPCGSVTGAPKYRTMDIIHELETKPRGVYCGAIGMIAPDNDMVFNVPIRTLTIAGPHLARLYTGGGIVYDSLDSSEYSEALLKAQFVQQAATHFKLLEAYRYQPETGAPWRADHLARLQNSAQDLGFTLQGPDLFLALDALEHRTDFDAKIRIELAANGSFEIEAIAIQPTDWVSDRVVLCAEPVHSDDPALQYKTSRREFYARHFHHAREAFNALDVIFVNQKDELTEAANHNLFLRFGKTYQTPPLEAGVLAGIGRAKFIENHDVTVCAIPRERLDEADEILLVSSVRGINSVRLC